MPAVVFLNEEFELDTKEFHKGRIHHMKFVEKLSKFLHDLDSEARNNSEALEDWYFWDVDEVYPYMKKFLDVYLLDNLQLIIEERHPGQSFAEAESSTKCNTDLLN